MNIKRSFVTRLLRRSEGHIGGYREVVIGTGALIKLCLRKRICDDILRLGQQNLSGGQTWRKLHFGGLDENNIK